MLLRAIVVVAVLVSVAPPAGAAPVEVERVLVLSVPAIAWEDLDDVELPHLEVLLAGSAIGDLSVRGVRRSTDAADGYTTLGAGARARGSDRLAGVAFGPDEPYGGGRAAEAYERATGRLPAPGSLFHVGIASVLARNERLRFGAEVGALAEALDDAGVARAVVANADVRGPSAAVELGREAVSGLMDGRGLVPGGSVHRALLVEDPAAPFGERLDVEAVGEAFDEAWAEGPGVVLVEASDLVRADAARPLVGPAQRMGQRRAALSATDDLVGRLLEGIDLGRDAVVVVGPSHATGRVHLTLAAVHAPGVSPGLLRSASTRRSGFVTLVDVAPTVLDLLGIAPPSSMEGRPFERGAGGGDHEARVELLVEANRAARFRDSKVAPVTTAFVVLNVVLCLLAIAALMFGRRAWRVALAGAALAVVGFVAATYLAGLVPFHRYGDGPFWLFLVGVGALAGATCLAVGHRRLLDPLLLALGALVALLLVDVVMGAPLQLNTVYGYSPTVGGRFAGFGNLAFGALSASALLLAGLLAARFDGRRGRVAAVAVLVVAVVADGLPMLGSDVGGVLTLVPAGGLTVALLFGRRPRWRSVLALGASGVATVTALALVDLTRPEGSRTHLGRLAERIGDEGVAAFSTVVLRKLDANLSVLTRSVWTLMVPVVFGFFAYVVWRAPGRLQRLREERPELQCALAGLGVAALLGFALNDSGIAVPGVMLGVVNASVVYLLVRLD